MNLHVVGDSFATYDEEASHWATIWGEANGVNVSHYGCRGKDHVFIVSNYLDHKHIEHADLVVYQVTDFLRLQINTPPLTHLQMIDALLHVYQRHTYPELINMATTDTSNMFNTQPMCATDSAHAFYLSSKQVYSSISHTWLVQATWFAMNNLYLECKLRGIPMIVVPDNSISYFDRECTVFKKFEYVFIAPFRRAPELAIATEHSINHYNITAHKRYAELFHSFVQENNLY